jgi:serine/threonine-protein kinase
VPLDAAVAIVAAAAAGLDHAHRRSGLDGAPLRLVHRDVSLSNIMVGHDGAVKVVDFGIASTTIASIHTSPGMVRGKASYMSPEQCLGEPVDLRADVFGLGVVLYELTTGVRCYGGKGDFDRMLAVVRGDYIAPSDLVAGYPLALERVVRRALEVSPARRFASAAEMIDALERISIDEGWLTGPRPIQRVMRRLFSSFGDSPERFGEPTEPAQPLLGDAPVTESRSIVSLPVVEPTRRGRRLACGTAAVPFDDDGPTRGRGRLRRPGRLAG